MIYTILHGRGIFAVKLYREYSFTHCHLSLYYNRPLQKSDEYIWHNNILLEILLRSKANVWYDLGNLISEFRLLTFSLI